MEGVNLKTAEKWRTNEILQPDYYKNSIKKRNMIKKMTVKRKMIKKKKKTVKRKSYLPIVK